MRQIKLWGALLAGLLIVFAFGLVQADEGDLSEVRWYVAQNPQARVLFIGDSWFHGDSYPGEVVNPSTGRPYTFAGCYADRVCSMGNEFPQALARRLETNRYAVLAQGSMELMLDDDADTDRAQQDSSIYGLMRPAYAEHFRPDIVILPGGGGGNDLFGGSNYAELRAEAIATAKRAINEFRDAKWVVWVSPRPFALYNFSRQAGTDDQKRVLAVAEYDIWEDFNTFVADTLRTELADDGYRVNRFVTFDSWDYAVGDTTGMSARLGSSTAAEYATIQHMRYSPLSWYQSDGVHLNDYGNKCYADSIAAHLFDIELSNSYTKGSGATIYMDAQNGDNWENAMDCTSRTTPLATLQAAVDHAHPGDIVRVIGTGNQAALAYDSTGAAWVSAKPYELRAIKPGVNIVMESGAYFAGVYDASSLNISSGLTSVGSGFIHPHLCTAGTISDSLSHDGSSDFTTANPAVNLDLTIEGGQVKGYQYTLRWYNYTNMEFKDLEVIGGAANGGIYPENYGQPMVLDMDGVTCYVDSSYTSPSNNALGANVDLSFTGTTTGASAYYTGTWRDCRFIGSEDATTNTAVTGAPTGITFINCIWQDTETATQAGVSFLAADCTSYWTTKFINCRFDYSDSGNIYAIYLQEAWTAGDSLIIVNTAANLQAAGGTAYIVENAAAPDAAFVTYVAGSTFVKVNYPSGRTDFTPGSPTAPDGGTKNWTVTASTYVAADSDTMMFGGVRAWLAYDLTDDFGVSHAPRHASIGPTQFLYSPTIVLGSSGRDIPSYARFSFDQIVNLYCTENILDDCNPLDPNTYIEVTAPALSDPRGLAEKDLLIEAWSRWYDATGQYVGLPTAGDRGDVILKF